MLSAWRPEPAISAGVLRPMLRKRKQMWITAVYVQLPDPRNIVLQGASRHGYAKSFGVRRKSGTARHHVVGVPDFLYVLSVGVAHVDRFLFVESNRLPIRGITCAARGDISQPLRWTAQYGHGPDCSPLCLIVQIALQQ